MDKKLATENDKSMKTLHSSKKVNFTEAFIASLPFAEKGKRYMVYDKITKSLILRVGETSKVYYLMKKLNNKVIYVKLGDASNTNLKDARELLVDNMKVINDGANPNEEKKKLRLDITLKEFYDTIFVPIHSKPNHKHSTQRIEDSTMRLYLQSFYNRKMLDVTRSDIEMLHKKLGGEFGIYAANRAVRLVRQMYNKAIDWGFPSLNPAARIKLFKEKSRDRFLQEDELPKFFEALSRETNIMFKNFVLLCLFLGQRRSNMLAIKWSDVNFERGILYIKETKNGDPQLVPIPTYAMKILEEMHTFSDSEWLFPSPKSVTGHMVNPQKMWKQFLERANIKDLRIHDLRRTFASYQAINGSSHEIIGKALGDKSPAVIPVYARLTENPVRLSIQSAADTIMNLGCGEDIKP